MQYGKTGMIIVAAGMSTRLESPKQLIRFRGRTLLRIAIDAALGGGVDRLVIVTGAFREKILKEIPDDDRIIEIYNRDFIQGMGNSLACGLRYLNKQVDLKGVIISVSDQPFLDWSIIKKLITTGNQDPSIIVQSKYTSGCGPPVYFGKDYFPLLQSLEGDEGGREVVRSHRDVVLYVPFPNGFVDIDTPDDLRLLEDLQE